MTRADLLAIGAVALVVALIVAMPREGTRSEAPALSPAAVSPSAAPARNPSLTPVPTSTATTRATPPPPGTTAPPLELVTRTGIASWVGGHGDDYLALPWGRGIAATICGAGGCCPGPKCDVPGISTDAGPDQRLYPERVADLSPFVFVRVCGVPIWYGLCDVTVTRQ